MQNINLLKAGRYFRLSESAKLIVGRDENENNMLTSLAKDGDFVFGPATINGPIAVGKGQFSPHEIDVACRIVARYCDRDGELDADISYRRLQENEVRTARTPLMDDADLAKLRALLPL
jgi:hypothetical protein